MTKYLSIGLVLSLIFNVGGFLYFNSRLDAKDALLKLERNKVAEAIADVKALNEEVSKLNGIVKVKDVEYENINQLFEEYKRRVSSIKPRTIKSVETIIQEVPADLVIEQVNQESNETIRRINTSADEFKRVRDN